MRKKLPMAIVIMILMVLCLAGCKPESAGNPEGKRGGTGSSENITSVTYNPDNKLANVDLDPCVNELDSYGKILCLSEITEDLCERDDVEQVIFTVDHLPLSDSRGNLYGILSKDSFVENEGALINAYERAELHLYFASEDGKSLVETRESLVYSSNISTDRLVVEKIISGPLSSGAFPTVNPSTGVNVVTTLDGVCYVDLDRQFLNRTTNVTDEVMIYSLVNSLTALTGINKVQILIDGSSDDPLVSSLYERNLELVM